MCFKCSGCGECCKNFREKDKCIPLFSWEVEELKKISNEKNINIEFKPIKYLLEENSGIVFVYLYGINEEVCPFLMDNQCSIYEKRPLVCRHFPLLWTASFNLKQGFGAGCFSCCSSFDCKQDFERYFLGEERVSHKEIDLYLKETYGACFESAQISNSLAVEILRIIKVHNLSNDFQVKEILEEQLKSYKILSFPDFLKFKNLNGDLDRLEKIYSAKR